MVCKPPLSRQRGLVAESDRGNFPYVDVQAGMFGTCENSSRISVPTVGLADADFFFGKAKKDLKLRCGSCLKKMGMFEWQQKISRFFMATCVHFQVQYVGFQGVVCLFPATPGIFVKKEDRFERFRY